MRNLRLLPNVTQFPGGVNPRISPREADVLALAHLRRAEIAQELGISEETVKVHLRNACLKLGAETRTGAALAWRERMTTLTLTATASQRQAGGRECVDSARASAGRACVEDLRTTTCGLPGDIRRVA